MNKPELELDLPQVLMIVKTPIVCRYHEVDCMETRDVSKERSNGY